MHYLSYLFLFFLCTPLFASETVDLKNIKLKETKDQSPLPSLKKNIEGEWEMLTQSNQPLSEKDKTIPEIQMSYRQKSRFKSTGNTDADGTQQIEYTIQELRSKTSLRLPAINMNRKTEQNLGIYFKKYPLLLHVKEGEIQSISNLEEIRKKIMADILISSEKTAVAQLLEEEKLRKITFEMHSGCLKEAAGKRPGDKWNTLVQMSDGAQQALCKFDNWHSFANGKVALIQITFPLASSHKSNEGGEANIQTKGSGYIRLWPAGKSLYTQTTMNVRTELSGKTKAKYESLSGGKPAPVQNIKVETEIRFHPLKK